MEMAAFDLGRHLAGGLRGPSDHHVQCRGPRSPALGAHGAWRLRSEDELGHSTELLPLASLGVGSLGLGVAAQGAFNGAAVQLQRCGGVGFVDEWVMTYEGSGACHGNGFWVHLQI